MTGAGREWSETDFRDRLEQRIKSAGLNVSLTGSSIEQLSRYFQLLRKWNRRINLTALPLETFPASTTDRLFVEPLAAAQFIPDRVGTWLDLGSGGGSPALPLKIVRPSVSLTMVESRSKKAAFLREAVKVLALGSAEVVEARIEELSQKAGGSLADLITIRGVKLDSPIVEAVRFLLRTGGQLILFGSSALTVDLRAEQSGTSLDPASGPAVFIETQSLELFGGGTRILVLEKS